ASGTSQDCNGNGIPDECDVANGAADCNGDLVPDECQLVDIAVAKTIEPPVSVVAEVTTFTVTVTNNSTWAAPVDAYELVPPSFVVVNAVASAGTVTDLGGGLYWLNIPSLAGGASATLVISALPTQTGEFVNQASAESCLPDPVENNVAQATVYVGDDCNNNGIEDRTEVTPQETSVLFQDGFESGAAQWALSGLWHLENGDPCGVGSDSLTSPTRAAYNLSPSQCDYDAGFTSGALEMLTDVSLPAPYGAVLKWYNFVETEHSYPFDQWVVQVSDNGGATWTTVYDPRGDSRPAWQELSVSLEAYAGKSIRVRFYFDSIDEEFNSFLGWYVDDVRIIALGPPLGSDCNMNLVPDECDITSGTSMDCNQNGTPDECEIGQLIRLESAAYEPFDGQTPQTIVFNASPTVGPVALTVTGYGDFGDHILETFDVYVGGTYLTTTWFANSGEDCTLGQAHLTIPAAMFNAAISGGTVSLTFVPSPYVDTVCPGSMVQASLRYLVDSPALDCNTNGVPDECDIASGTSQDCNANGVPDEC
uniref:hypothetical protein n=1 Tax=Thermogutta sp. TaxID=1962930 RepID=UPI00322020C5